MSDFHIMRSEMIVLSIHDNGFVFLPEPLWFWSLQCLSRFSVRMSGMLLCMRTACDHNRTTLYPSSYPISFDFYALTSMNPCITSSGLYSDRSAWIIGPQQLGRRTDLDSSAIATHVNASITCLLRVWKFYNVCIRSHIQLLISSIIVSKLSKRDLMHFIKVFSATE